MAEAHWRLSTMIDGDPILQAYDREESPESKEEGVQAVMGLLELLGKHA